LIRISLELAAMIPSRLQVLAVLAVGLGAPVLAQDRPAVPPVSVEVSLGAGVGRGGTFRDRVGVALDATLGWRVRPTADGALVLALSGAVQGSPAAVDICLLTPDGTCVPAYPFFYSVGLTGGREWALRQNASDRFLAGPAYYGAGNRHGAGSRAFGLQGRVDVATPPLWRVALLGSFRGAVLPSYGGDAHVLAAAGLGVRVR
jgi:hypothetical protein